MARVANSSSAAISSSSERIEFRSAASVGFVLAEALGVADALDVGAAGDDVTSPVAAGGEAVPATTAVAPPMMPAAIVAVSAVRRVRFMASSRAGSAVASHYSVRWTHPRRPLACG